MQPFNANDYAALYALAFNENNPGYKPFSLESPNGDGKFDHDKRYAHIAMKYIDSPDCTLDECESDLAEEYLEECMNLAIEVAISLGLPREFWPDKRYSALRILEYKPGAISHLHTDFDLFTLMMYRNIPECFVTIETQVPALISDLNTQIHFGELLEVINDNYKATEHTVLADPLNRTQYSIVFFAIPDHDVTLPDGTSVGDWIDERIGRSRKEAY